jgi:hypothetical protein
MDAELFKIDRRKTRLEIKLRQADADVIQLESEHTAAIRADVERQIEETENEMLADCLALDDGVARLLISNAAVLARRDKLIQLSRQIGRDATRYEKIAAHLRRSVNGQLFGRGGDNVWMTSNTRGMYEQPFSKFLEGLLRAEPTWIDVTADELTTDAAKAS